MHQSPNLQPAHQGWGVDIAKVALSLKWCGSLDWCRRCPIKAAADTLQTDAPERRLSDSTSRVSAESSCTCSTCSEQRAGRHFGSQVAPRGVQAVTRVQAVLAKSTARGSGLGCGKDFHFQAHAMGSAQAWEDGVCDLQLHNWMTSQRAFVLGLSTGPGSAAFHALLSQLRKIRCPGLQLCRAAMCHNFSFQFNQQPQPRIRPQQSIVIFFAALLKRLTQSGKGRHVAQLLGAKAGYSVSLQPMQPSGGKSAALDVLGPDYCRRSRLRWQHIQVYRPAS